MKKCLCLLLLLLAIPFLAAAKEAALTPDEVLALGAPQFEGGAVINTQDCALMIAYAYHNDEGTQESLDALMARIDSQAAEVGYVPIVNSGEGDNVYALMPNDLSGVTAIVLGEADTLCPGVLSGGTRRFAKTNVLWPAPEGCSGWNVAFIEEQDYYEENGAQYPCYYALLTPQ